MEIVGIRELKERATEILRRVRDEGESFEVTYHGRVIARIILVTGESERTSLESFRDRWEALSREVSARWPPGVSAVEAVREQRREL